MGADPEVGLEHFLGHEHVAHPDVRLITCK
jgi:hypothetical protein